MKTVLTLIATFIFGITAMAQDVKNVKVEVINIGAALNIDLGNQNKTKTQMARLYRYKNSRVKKELAFRTKRNRSKLA